MNLSVDFDDASDGISSSHSRSDLLYGGGFGFTVAERLHVRAEYETIRIENASSSGAIWLSTAWRF